MKLTPVLDRLESEEPAALARLMDLLRIPSISTDPAYATECTRAAEWLIADLLSIGFDASLRETPGHPMVVAHHDGPGPHVLFYGHYDVQPIDPLALWTRDPFDPVVEDTAKGQVIRGRGSSDDKGQVMTFIEACRAWKAVHGSLPLKVTVFLEGEEESGSPSLIPFMKENARELTSDIALICDTGLFGEDTPAIITMLRGLLTEELTVTGPSKDLHSGMYGGISMNPIRALSRALAALHDETGHVTVPGFYEGVPEIPADVMAQWQALGFDPQTFLGEAGLSAPAGEADRTPLEQLWARPTCDVNGIWGGYTGEGFKTVLPAQAHAKVSFRLVGQQDPLKIRENFRAFIQSHMPPDCTVGFKGHGASPAAQMATDHPAFEKARVALSDEWPHPAAYIGCGASIPIAGYFKTVLGMDSMLIGFGKDDDAIHSPNEKYDLVSFRKGARSWARILSALAA
ncbi:acetylornithine deacetylase/succinyl-diaminopimelate desuccinylase-like protein [Rhodovulum imhoffii]|uniref:Acetylornithine deacetylase/succinyl-diaminopimelate desuccinylase-like protein n=1 Tax=Rhodovulum imhoffii TaxID=365340 RepID=A0A2T5BVW8_9RHOB|nr:M20/M25/M40 family metallo-hydrolase [Rhodovulum imhoffii]MBK5933214.1 hypothetical protein [Rhodovulum imhoffii]PTN03685.1 acetylornithine deacetylase/succinyl-diaminopimelate desuccinylase-like protein [Rhodovulum imhoffii]